MTFLYFSMNSKCYDLVKQFIYHFQLNLFYPERMSSSLRKCDISEFINIVSILLYKFIEFVIMLYIFLVISFAGYKEYIISLISFSKFSDVLPAFTCGVKDL